MTGDPLPPPLLQALIEGAGVGEAARQRGHDHAPSPRGRSRPTTQPSYAVVRRLVDDLDPAMVTLAMMGPVSYRDRYELVRRAAPPPTTSGRPTTPSWTS